MKSWFSRLQSTPVLSRRDLFLVVVPALLWLAAVYSRPFVITPHCTASQPCKPEQVLAIDRPSIGIENGDADFFSYLTQNTSGVLAASVPVLFHGGLALAGQISPAGAWMALGTDLVILTEASLANGFLMEAARVTFQRPRPFVYADPSRAPDPQNYTSFYSGHTSFAAAACMTLLLTLLGRRAPIPLLVGAAIIGQALVFSTGIFRILSGRHFLTDVLTAAVMGTLVAVFVAWTHRRTEDASRL